MFYRSYYLVSITLLTSLIIVQNLYADRRTVKVPQGKEVLVSININKKKTYKTISLSDDNSNHKIEEHIQIGKTSIKRFCHKFLKLNPKATCEPNTAVQLKQIPNDPNYTSLWGMQKISAENAWDISTGSSDVFIAVIDTGVDYTHPDLAANIAINTNEIPNNGVDDDANGYVDDYYGYDFSDIDGDPMDKNNHGTHVAGTIGAVGNDANGISGVNWNTRIIATRVLDTHGNGTFADIALGVDYAVLRGAHILNLSIGGEQNSRALRNSIRSAAQNNILVVAAAGNEGSNNDSTPSFPASYLMPNVISVSASNQSDQLAYFSNYGSSTVHLAAPGVGILSTIRHSSYDTYEGTSMASPHVAGVAGLVKAANPMLGALDIHDLIINNVDLSDGLSGTSISGGRLNAFASVAAALSHSPQATLDLSNDNISITLQKAGQRRSKKVRFSGEIIDASLGKMAFEELTLYCNGKYRGEAKSNRLGTFSFRISRDTKKSLKCYVEDAGNMRSTVIKVKASTN